MVVEWDQPYVTGCTATPSSRAPGRAAASICASRGAAAASPSPTTTATRVSCTGPNAVGVDPYQILIIGNPANAAGTSAQQSLNIIVGLATNANGTPVPGRIIVTVEDDGLGSTINSFATNSATIQGHPGAAGAAAVGAAFYFDTPRCGTTPATLESFSSEGGAPILFDTAGVRLATPVVRQKPDFVGPDGVNNTFLGFTLASAGITGSNGLLNTTISECQNASQLSEFLRHLGGDAACGGDCRIDAASEPRRHAGTDLQFLARQRTADERHDPQFQFRLRIHPGRFRAGGADALVGGCIDPSRQFDHAHLVVDLRDGLHRIEHTRHDLERSTGNERRHDADSRRRRHHDLYVDLYECVRHIGRRLGEPDGHFGNGAGGADAVSRIEFNSGRQLDDDQLVLRRCDELHGGGELERDVGHERQHEYHAHGSRNPDVHFDLQQSRRAIRAELGHADRYIEAGATGGAHTDAVRDVDSSQYFDIDHLVVGQCDELHRFGQCKYRGVG